MEKYLWKIKNYEYSSLSDSITCDTLIVGGGITGISLLYYLKDYDFLRESEFGYKIYPMISKLVGYIPKEKETQLDLFGGEQDE